MSKLTASFKKHRVIRASIYIWILILMAYLILGSALEYSIEKLGGLEE